MPVCLVATRFHFVEGMCKLETRTHMGKLAPTWENSHPPLFVATRFHLVEGKCKLKTRTHMGKAVAMAL